MNKDSYEDLRKRNKSLPSFEELDLEFEISTIEGEGFALRNVKKRIAENIDNIAGLLSDIIHPNSDSMAAMYEWRFFDPKEKKNIVAMYRKTQYLMRLLDESELLADESNDVQVICELLKAWKDLKKECIPITKRLKECWTRETEYKEDLGYLG